MSTGGKSKKDKDEKKTEKGKDKAEKVDGSEVVKEEAKDPNEEEESDLTKLVNQINEYLGKRVRVYYVCVRVCVYV